MRSTQELIAELDTATREHEFAFITVATGRATAEFISDVRAERLSLFMAEGGVPVGLVLLDRVKGRLRATTRVYPQYLAALTPAALGFPDGATSTPAKMAKVFLKDMAESLTYDLDGDQPYRLAIDAAIRQAGEAGFRWPLKVMISFPDSLKRGNEAKSFTLFDPSHLSEPDDDDGDDYYLVIERYGWLVTHCVNLEPDAPRPWPPHCITVYDSSLPILWALALSLKTGASTPTRRGTAPTERLAGSAQPQP